MNSRAMLKLSNLLQSRNQLQRKLFGENVKDSLRGHDFICKAGISTAGRNFPTDGKVSDRVYADYSIYKGKASLSAYPTPPKFSKLNSGCLKVDRSGTIMLSFSPAIGERKYDWEKKQFFALSATEVGSLISLGPTDSCEFFHDPAIKSSNAGKVRKTLQVRPHADGSGYFISLSVVDNVKQSNERFTVPVTKAEFAVMRTSFSFALPHIMGWDRYTDQHPKNEVGISSMVDPRLKSLEWDR